MDRREFLKMAGVSLVFVSGLPHLAGAAEKLGSKAKPAGKDFYFVQLSDTHWGFDNPKINPDPTGTLPKAIELVNALPSTRISSSSPGICPKPPMTTRNAASA